MKRLNDQLIIGVDHGYGNILAGLMSQEKANQKERLKIPMERIRKYFPKHYTTAQMEDAIVKMCEAQFRRRADRDAR